MDASMHNGPLDRPRQSDEGVPEPVGGLPPAALIRAEADGELSCEQRERLAAHLARHPDDHAAIEFERRLRGSCCRVMSCCCPDQLRRQVASMAAQSAAEPGGADAPHVRRHDPHDRSPPDHHRPVPGSAGGSPGRRRLLAALVAGIALGVGGLLLVQSARNTTPAVAPADAAYRTQLAQYVVQEHNRALAPEVAAVKFTMRDLDSVDVGCRGILGQCPNLVERLGGGELRLVGAGPCGLPGDGRSVHLRLERIPSLAAGAPAEPADNVSLFVKEDRGELPLIEGKLYQFDNGACDITGARVLAWREAGLLYVVVAQSVDSGEPACTPLLRLAGFRERPQVF